MAIIIILLILVGEYVFSPRIDYTRDGKYLLWYNGWNNREYIRLN